MLKNNIMFVVNKSNLIMNDNNGQSAAKSLNTTVHEKRSTTIPRKGSTLFDRVEKAHFKFYSLTEKLPQNKGIYGIYCITNDTIYIGSANNFHARLIRHTSYLKRNAHHSPKLQRAWNKYTIKAFLFVIIEEIIDDLAKAEEKWINIFDSYKNGFNCTDVCQNYKPFNLTSEQIQKRIEKSSKSVICLDLEGNYLCKYKSLTEAAKTINDQTTNISSCCRGKLNFVKDFIFVYTNDYSPNIDYAYKPKKRIFTDTHKKRISERLKGLPKNENQRKSCILRSSKKVKKYNSNNEFIKEYDSMKQCCIENKLYIRTLRQHILLKTPLEGFLYELMKI